MNDEPMQKTFKDLHDSLQLMANVEKLRPRIRSEEDQASVEANVAEVSDKLHRLLNRSQNDWRFLNSTKLTLRYPRSTVEGWPG